MSMGKHILKSLLISIMCVLVICSFSITADATTYKTPTGVKVSSGLWNEIRAVWDSPVTNTNTTILYEYEITSNGAVVKNGNVTLRPGYIMDGTPNAGTTLRCSFTYEECLPDTTYEFKLRRAKSDGSPWTDTYSVTTGSYNASAGTVTVYQKSRKSIQVKFYNSGGNGKYTDPTGCYVYRSSDNGKTYKKIAAVKAVSASKTVYLDKTVKSMGKYKYRINAYKTVGDKTYVSTNNDTVSRTIYAMDLPKVSAKAVIVKKKVPSNKDYLKLTWGKLSVADGYEAKVDYSDGNVQRHYKKSVKKNQSRSWKISVKKLGCYSSVYTKVRCYKIVKGKKIYGDWVYGQHTDFFRG